MRSWTRTLAGVLALVVMVVACRGDTSVVAEFRTPDGVSYRILLDGDAAERVRDAHRTGERPGIPVGRINRGDGGINTGHDWHITEVEFADMAIEVCDGNAGYIDELGYDAFVDQHGDYFCPWSAELVGVADR